MPCTLVFIGDRPANDNPGASHKGDLVTVWAPGHPRGVREVVPRFVFVNITNRMRSEVIAYRGEWTLELAFSVLSHDPVTDTYMIRISAEREANHDIPGVPDRGRVTRAKVERYLNGWGITVESATSSSVDCEVNIFTSLQSRAFWEYPAIVDGVPIRDAIDFTEIAYDQVTGVHRIEMDYSAAPVPSTQVELRAEKLGCTIVDHQVGALTFEADRSEIFSKAKAEIKDKARRTVYRSRWGIDPTTVDNLINSHGGEVSIPAGQMLNYLRDVTA